MIDTKNMLQVYLIKNYASATYTDSYCSFPKKLVTLF